MVSEQTDIRNIMGIHPFEVWEVLVIYRKRFVMRRKNKGKIPIFLQPFRKKRVYISR